MSRRWREEAKLSQHSRRRLDGLRKILRRERQAAQPSLLVKKPKRARACYARTRARARMNTERGVAAAAERGLKCSLKRDIA